MSRVALVPTGTANVASVEAALRRAGAEPFRAACAADVASADRLVLPGVGTFAAAASELGERGFWQPLAERIAAGRPTLTICLGLQLLAEASAESPGVRGLGAIPGTVRRLPAGVRVPELGWNQVQPDGDWLTAGDAYFAHSFALFDPPPGWQVAFTTHGERFVSAIRRGRVLACQFHPELSGAWGARLIGNWLAGN